MFVALALGLCTRSALAEEPKKGDHAAAPAGPAAHAPAAHAPAKAAEPASPLAAARAAVALLGVPSKAASTAETSAKPLLAARGLAHPRGRAHQVLVTDGACRRRAEAVHGTVSRAFGLRGELRGDLRASKRAQTGPQRRASSAHRGAAVRVDRGCGPGRGGPRARCREAAVRLNLDAGLAGLYAFRGLNVFKSGSQMDQHALFAPGITYNPTFIDGLTVGYWGAFQLNGEVTGDVKMPVASGEYSYVTPAVHYAWSNFSNGAVASAHAVWLSVNVGLNL